MSGSTFGELFRVTNFGESHGPAIGCVIDGCPPGLPLAESDIQPELDRRRPGTSRHVTQRNEFRRRSHMPLDLTAFSVPGDLRDFPWTEGAEDGETFIHA